MGICGKSPHREPAMSTAKLIKFLTEHFKAPDDLRQLVATDETLAAAKLDEVVKFDDAPATVAMKLVVAAADRGFLPDLIKAATLLRPQLSGLPEWAALFGADRGVNQADVRFKAGQFDQAFLERRKGLGRLEMYKGLHDILHGIQTSHGELTRLVTAARKPGYNPVFAGLTPVRLGKWVNTATHFNPDRVPTWVPAFLKAARLVARCINGEALPAQEVDGRLEELRRLPADEQARLNWQLVDTARDLDISGLDAPLHELQAALGPNYGADLQQRYKDFQSTCTDLQQLIDLHDKCQKMVADLAKASVLAETAGVPPWDELRETLTRLKDAWPADAETLGRLVPMVDELKKAGSAAPPEWLDQLRAGFRQYFFELDAKLLDTTDRVIQTADVLDFRLKGYSK